MSGSFLMLLEQTFFEHDLGIWVGTQSPEPFSQWKALMMLRLIESHCSLTDLFRFQAKLPQILANICLECPFLVG